MTGAKIGEFISDDTETAQLAKALSLVLAVHWAMTPERRAVWLADLQSSLAAQLGSQRPRTSGGFGRGHKDARPANRSRPGLI
jgi:hypothetical protein